MQQISERVAERSADALSGGSIFTWIVVKLSELNTVLESLTLLVGLAAGIFALFFHYRRWRNERSKSERDDNTAE